MSLRKNIFTLLVYKKNIRLGLLWIWTLWIITRDPESSYYALNRFIFQFNSLILFQTSVTLISVLILLQFETAIYRLKPEFV